MGTAAVLGGLQVAQAYGQSEAIKSQADYQNTMMQINAAEAEAQGKRVLDLGDKAAIEHKKKVNQIVGEQRLGYASGGVDVNFGSAMEVQTEAREIGMRDVNEIRSNAFLEAMGYKSQAQEYRRSGAMGLAAARFESQQTLLTGALRGFQTYAGGMKDMASLAGGK